MKDMSLKERKPSIVRAVLNAAKYCSANLVMMNLSN